MRSGQFAEEKSTTNRTLTCLLSLMDTIIGLIYLYIQFIHTAGFQSYGKKGIHLHGTLQPKQGLFFLQMKFSQVLNIVA